MEKEKSGYRNETQVKFDIILKLYDAKINEYGPLGVNKIRDDLKISSGRTYRLLENLASYGAVVKEGKKYRISDKAVGMVEMFYQNPEWLEMMRELDVSPISGPLPEKKAPA